MFHGRTRSRCATSLVAHNVTVHRPCHASFSGSRQFHPLKERVPPPWIFSAVSRCCQSRRWPKSWVSRIGAKTAITIIFCILTGKRVQPFNCSKRLRSPQVTGRVIRLSSLRPARPRRTNEANAGCDHMQVLDKCSCSHVYGVIRKRV